MRATIYRHGLLVFVAIGLSCGPLLASEARDLRVRAFEGYAAFKQGDHERAYEILRPAAEAGHTGAMAQLAYLYEHGMGVKKDVERASFWSDRAGTDGDPAAEVTN